MTVSQDPESEYQLLPTQTIDAGNPESPAMDSNVDKLRRGDPIFHWAAMGAVTFLTIVTYFAVLANEPISKGWFAFHPLLASLSLALFTYGILTLQPTHKPMTKASGLTRHTMAIAFFGIPAMLLGVLAVSWNKITKGSDHFVTWHGKFGLLCVLILVVEATIGGGSIWFDGKLFGGPLKSMLVWKYHRALGYCLFPLILFTTHLGGAWSGWGHRTIVWWIRIPTYTALPLVIGLSILARIRFSKMPIFNR